MDLSYIEEESIHIRLPYLSEPHISINQVVKGLDDSEQQSSRLSESWQIEESDLHHHFIPYWSMVPSKSLIPKQSRPSTSIVLIPLKKHLLEESVYIEEEDKENDQFVDNSNFLYYGQTGRVVFRAFNCENNLENRILEEFSKDPCKVAIVAEECTEVIAMEFTILSKILIDLMVEYWKKKDLMKFKVWVGVAKEFYSAMEFPIFTNFVQEGILHFERKEEYLEYLEKLACLE